MKGKARPIAEEMCSNLLTDLKTHYKKGLSKLIKFLYEELENKEVQNLTHKVMMLDWKRRESY